MEVELRVQSRRVVVEELLHPSRCLKPGLKSDLHQEVGILVSGFMPFLGFRKRIQVAETSWWSRGNLVTNGFPELPVQKPLELKNAY